MDWNEYFFRHVYLAAQKSKDSRTKIGAVLVRADSNSIISEGFNGICRGVYDPDLKFHSPSNPIFKRLEKPVKYAFFEHAERNGIYNCARHGISTLGTKMFTQGIPCADCARGIIQAGVSTVVIHKQWPNLVHSEKWVESVGFSKEMFAEANVEIEIFDKVLKIEGFLDGQTVYV